MPPSPSPLHLLLVVAPVAMLLAALALAAGQRRARARRARASLGRPAGRVDAAAEGERVLVEGVLHAAGEPAARFEDGAPCAAATVESVGERAFPEGAAPRFKAGPEPSVAHGARAEALVLTVGGDRVALHGAASVFVGSREVDPDAPFSALAPAVRERIAGVAPRASLPGAPGPGPVHAEPAFRSLRSGDRVWAAGRLVRQSEGDRTGYRDRAPWALEGDASGPVVLAFDGTPRHVGSLGAIFLGVRRVSRARVAVVAIGALGLVVGIANRDPPQPPAAKEPAAPPPVNMMGRRILADAEQCGALRTEYQAVTRKLGACAADADCVAEVRGGPYYGLGGCHRFRHRDAPVGEAQRLETEWLDKGCQATYEICPPAPLAMCREGQCMERPPPPLPETWRREDVPGDLFLYVPPDVKRLPGVEDDDIVAAYSGGGFRLTIEVVEGSVDTTGFGGALPQQDIGGCRTDAWKTARELTLLFPRTKGCLPIRCLDLAQQRLMVSATCDSDEACEGAWLAARSVRFW